MVEQIAVLSPGVWNLKDMVRELTGYEPVRWTPLFPKPEFGCVVGWGLKPTSRKARRLARKSDTTYVAMEDGFIRSLLPGPQETPVSLIVDRSGVYYDALGGSDLEGLIFESASWRDKKLLCRAREGMRLLRENKISKYNHAPCLTPEEMGLATAPERRRVLVVDQTYGDSSVDYGLAEPESFTSMLESAIRENPGAEIIVKVHPEVVSGRKKGYLARLGLNDERVKVVGIDVNPWSLIEIVDKVYVVTSQLGFEAMLAGRDVVCFGAPFYAGWGLTDDRVTVFRRKMASPTREQIFAAVYFNYCHYVHPVSKCKVDFEEAVEWLVARRRESLGKSFSGSRAG